MLMKSQKLLNITIFIIFFIMVSLAFSLSCQKKDLITGDQAGTAAPDSLEKNDQIYFFDYTKIIIDTTQSQDIKIKNSNIYADIYGDLIILGEIVNSSTINKTDLEATFNFYDKLDNLIDSKTLKTFANYLKIGGVLPFIYNYEEKSKYIDIAKIKIGINYKNYNKDLIGNPIVTSENFYYSKDILKIEGKVINLGQNKIEDLKLLATFYNNKNQVVFVRKCSYLKNSLLPLEEENFNLDVLIDEYIQPFTHYGIEAFFKDSLKT
ncbi:MAG: hypothetical protein L6405_04925 [Actinomycetia bacterium]|nr:hypothetical protein [Actinomycetes bacterium]